MLLSSGTCLLLLLSVLLSFILVTATETLIPSIAEGCPYIAENCTQLELLPVPRNDSFHQNIAASFAQK